MVFIFIESFTKHTTFYFCISKSIKTADHSFIIFVLHQLNNRNFFTILLLLLLSFIYCLKILKSNSETKHFLKTFYYLVTKFYVDRG